MTAGYGYDEEAALLLIVRNDRDSDEEYRGFLDWVARLDHDAAARSLDPVFILVTSRHTPAPNARWRRELADAANRARCSNTCALIVTESAIQRGVLNTIRWLQPKPRGSTHACKSFAEACSIAESHRKTPLRQLGALLDAAVLDLSLAEKRERDEQRPLRSDEPPPR